MPIEDEIDLKKLNAQQKVAYQQWLALNKTFDLEAALEALATKKESSSRTTKPTEKQAAVIRECRSVLAHLEKKVDLVRVDCWVCKRPFACDYLHVRLCSDECLATHLFDTLGVKWSPSKSIEERWDYGEVPPGIVRPETLSKLQDWARRILSLPTVQEVREEHLPISDLETVIHQGEVSIEIAPKIASLRGQLDSI